MMHALEVGDMLPDMFVTTKAGTTVALHPPVGTTTVIVCCRSCDDYLRDMDTIGDEFHVWEARLVVLPSDRDRILVADRYGQVFYATSEFPSPRELTEWLKHLGTLCPE